MKTIHLYLVLLLVLCSCNQDQDKIFVEFELSLVGTGPYGNLLQFKLESTSNLEEDDFLFYVDNVQVFPEKVEGDIWELTLEELATGIHTLRVVQFNNTENEKMKSFQKEENLLTLSVHPNYLAQEVSHFLVIWTPEGEQWLLKEIENAGELKIPIGQYEAPKMTLGMFTAMPGFNQGIGQVIQEIPIGHLLELNMEEEEESDFGTATLQFSGNSVHDEYWVGSRGSFNHGNQLPASYPIFLDIIPSRIFLRTMRNSKFYAHLYTEPVQASGQNLSLNLNELEELETLTIPFSDQVLGSAVIFGFEEANELTSQFPLQIEPLESAQQVLIGDYSSIFPKVELQLNYQKDDSQIFSRYRGGNFPEQIDLFDADFLLEKGVEQNWTFSKTGEFDLVFSVWIGTAEDEMNWFVFLSQNPENSDLIAPVFSWENKSLSEVFLGRVLIEESDQLAGYQDFIADFRIGNPMSYDWSAAVFHSKFRNTASARVDIAEFKSEKFKPYFKLPIIANQDLY